MAEHVAHFVVPFYVRIIIGAERERIFWHRVLVEQRRKVRSLSAKIRILEQRKEHKKAKQLRKELEEESCLKVTTKHINELLICVRGI